jgi:hypothetical protein
MSNDDELGAFAATGDDAAVWTPFVKGVDVSRAIRNTNSD